MTIPASQIVQVNPGVLAAGGQALDIVEVILTESTQVPIGAVQPFATAADVGDYFGTASTEYALALIYFNGFEDSHIKPALVYFTQYPSLAVAPYIRGGDVSGLTLTELQAITTGSLTVTFDGSPELAATVNLSSVTSFSDAASTIEAAFTTPSFSVSYDSISGAFVFTGSTTGAAHTCDFAADNALSQALKLTQATGAVTSQGADAASPGTFMDGVAATTTDWATFMTAFDPDASGNDNKLAFAAWTNSQNKRYAYVCWDTDVSGATTVPATSSLGYLIGTLGNNYGGTYLIAGDGGSDSVPASASHAAFVCGIGASIDFTQHNGRVTFAFRRQEGLAATCTNGTSASNLISNGYNFYGAYATANDQFVWNYPGQISGEFLWMDSYINQIWLNNQLQLAIMVLYQNTYSIPYNKQGYALIEAACFDPILAGVNFGAIRAGITLSSAQVAEMNSAAGLSIDKVVSANGWYLQVLDASAAVRAARESPPCTLWYTDGQSVQKIALASIEVQ